MGPLLAVLLLFVALALGFGLLVLPVVLVVQTVRSLPPRTSVPSDRRWTDDDEIAARHHR